MKLHLRSSAKVNLSLDILNRRPDGYHELASVVHTVGLFDAIELTVDESDQISFSCSREDLAGDDNLCVRAVKIWNEMSGFPVGAQIHLEKRIPTGAGLGGGSGNAAAILIGLNRACGEKLSAEKLREMGARLGADVPLFLAGGAVLMEGIGEILTPLVPIECWIAIIKPEVSFSTPAIYKAWDSNDFRSVEGSDAMKNAILKQGIKEVAATLSNDLERAAAVISDVPTRLVKVLRESGAIGAQMSGSGSACFGIFEGVNVPRDSSHLLYENLAKDVQLHNLEIFVVPFCDRGVEVAP